MQFEAKAPRDITLVEQQQHYTAYVWAGQGRSTHHIEHIINFALLWAAIAIVATYLRTNLEEGDVVQG